MRIAFDIDELLIPYGQEFPVEKSVPFGLLRLFYPERLRQGATRLLQTLSRQHYDLWIYTTSGRSSLYMKTWFALLGIRLGGVVNCDVHEKQIRAHGDYYPRCTKYPPAFRMDLLIDNCEGIQQEGERYGFEVLRIDPADREWDKRILAYLQPRQK